MEGRGGRVGLDGEGSKNPECIQSCTTRNTTLSEVPVVLLVTTLLCRLHQLVREEGASIFVDVRTAAENSGWGEEEKGMSLAGRRGEMSLTRQIGISSLFPLIFSLVSRLTAGKLIDGK